MSFVSCISEASTSGAFLTLDGLPLPGQPVPERGEAVALPGDTLTSNRLIRAHTHLLRSSRMLVHCPPAPSPGDRYQTMRTTLAQSPLQLLPWPVLSCTALAFPWRSPSDLWASQHVTCSRSTLGFRPAKRVADLTPHLQEGHSMRSHTVRDVGWTGRSGGFHGTATQAHGIQLSSFSAWTLPTRAQTRADLLFRF